ncbi:hypothetical protein M426DRAFT_319197 [Hypoxylon sp. CI-4A]|nr:hypothetical protein M426DRAFT_319197 [Hypoxylon sp. CI-4A]
MFKTYKSKIQTRLSSLKDALQTSKIMGSLSSSPTTAFKVKKIAVVGAGPSGLAVAKYLLAQDSAFSQIDVFEQASEVGGVWNYSADPSPILELPVPQTNAHPQRPDSPLYRGKDGELNPLFPTPMYDDLNTNIPHTLMGYSDSSFPDSCEIYPRREDVQKYLVEYAKDVRHLIKFSTQVENIYLRKNKEGRDQWEVITTDMLTKGETKDTYDAVVVASGHYSTPYIPDIKNIREFHANDPESVLHSKLYRNADRYRDKKVVLVGTGASGLDIASQIQKVSKSPLLISAQTAVPPEVIEHIGNVKQIGEIKRFLPEERGIEYVPLAKSDGDDENQDDAKKEEQETVIETDIDVVLFCTGYLFTFPFLNSLSDLPLVTDGRRVHGLAKHFLHIKHPTLAFPGLPIKVIPFPLAESQGAVLARLWSNSLPLPPLEEWGLEDGEGKSPEKYHVFPPGGDGRYINELHDLVVQQGGGEKKGKVPPHWDEEMLWERTIFAEAKMQFEKTGKKAKTLEELGFRFEAKSAPPVEELEKKEPRLDTAG